MVVGWGQAGDLQEREEVGGVAPWVGEPLEQVLGVGEREQADLAQGAFEAGGVSLGLGKGKRPLAPPPVDAAAEREERFQRFAEAEGRRVPEPLGHERDMFGGLLRP